MTCGSSLRRMLGRRTRRYGGRMRWPRTVLARMRVLGPARLDGLTAAIVTVATLIELPLENLHDHRGVTYAAGVLLALAIALRRRTTLAVVAFQSLVVIAQTAAGGEVFDVAFVPFLALMVGAFTLAARARTRELVIGGALLTGAV